MIGAHPDDAEFGCGGLLASLAGSGAKLAICVVSGGALGGSPAVREREAKAAAESLGARLIWCDLPDTRIRLRPAIRAIESSVAEFDPDLILVHSPRDTHQDHRVVTRATLSASRQISNVLYYEGPSSRQFAPSAYFDIGPVMNHKLELIRRHRSQLERGSFEDWTVRTASYRGLQAKPRCEWAEGFYVARQRLCAATFATSDCRIHVLDEAAA